MVTWSRDLCHTSKTNKRTEVWVGSALQTVCSLFLHMWSKKGWFTEPASVIQRRVGGKAIRYLDSGYWGRGGAHWAGQVGERTIKCLTYHRNCNRLTVTSDQHFGRWTLSISPARTDPDPSELQATFYFGNNVCYSNEKAALWRKHVSKNIFCPKRTFHFAMLHITERR